MSEFRWGGSYNKRWTKLTTGVAGLVPIGFGCHIGSGQGEQASNVLPACQALNATAWRDDCTWSRTEPTRGTLVWPGTGFLIQIDAMATNGVAVGIEPIIQLGYGNANYGSDSPAGTKGGLVIDADEIAGFQAHCSWSVTKLAGRCKFFGLWNEWDAQNSATATEIALGYCDANHYKALMDAVYPVIKAANPQAQLAAGVTSGPEAWRGPGSGGWLWDLLCQPGFFTKCDAVDFHQYTNFDSPENYGYSSWINCQHIRQMAKDYSFPCWQTESGWFNGSDSFNVTQAVAAKYYSRYPFILRAIGLNLFSFWQLRNEGNDTAEESNFGLVTNSYGTTKLQFATCAAALFHAAKATAASWHSTQGFTTGRQAVLMTVAGQPRLAIWSLDGNVNDSVLVRSSSSGTLSIETIGSTTATSALSAGDTNVSISLTDTAQLISANVPISFPDFT